MNKLYNITAGLLIALLPDNSYSQTVTDTLKLYFDTGLSSFNSSTRNMLDSLFYNDVIAGNQTINIIGYTDYVGSEDYNVKLSKQRAQYVANYFLSMGIKSSQIKQRIGKGEVVRVAEQIGGYQADRKVDVILQMRKKAPVKPTPLTSINSNSVKTVTPNPVLQKMDIDTGTTFVLDKIYFYAGRHVVKPESLPEIDKLYNALAANNNITIQIEGHICCVRFAPDALDEDTNELALSANRAKYIYDYLIAKGIDARRLKYRGFGRLRPVVAKELTPEDEDRNRRVEIRILSR